MSTTNQMLNALSSLSMHQNAPSCAAQAQLIIPAEFVDDGSASSHPRRQPHHELAYDFPALPLLGRDEKLSMPLPYGVEYRPKPRQDALSLYGYYFSQEIFHYMPPQVPTNLSALQGSPTASRAFDTIDNLASNLGKTVISICPFESRQGVPGVRIGIRRTSLEGGIVIESWKLNEVEWKALLSNQNRAWIELLSEVFYRKTALTHLIATQKLTAQNYLLWHYDEDLCNRQGDHWNARFAGVLFQNRLIVQGTDRRVSRSQDFGPDPQSLCAVQLPCGHGLTIIKADLSNLTYEFCMSKTCDTCNARTMQESDIEEAKMAKKEAELEDAPKMADGWTELGWEK